ncbi:hypothetical protein [Streptomyces cyanogenus]|uniref:Uncharacterized protein n=1 Tax=Streptomyces cyanogenus TaxID=80860 RepID=A0ABX7TKI9_STRCY|nr:hypothetical protein [Streptomyces cyanogenus]QTD96001.1 hypothetical protein S1361_01520 [Streptomyces cyanogenus]
MGVGQDVEIEPARMKAQLPAGSAPAVGGDAAFTTALSALLDAARSLGGSGVSAGSALLGNRRPRIERGMAQLRGLVVT